MDLGLANALFELFPKSQKTETFTKATAAIPDHAEVTSLCQLTVCSLFAPYLSICMWSVENSQNSHKHFSFAVCAMSPLDSRGHLRDTVEEAALVSACCIVCGVGQHC